MFVKSSSTENQTNRLEKINVKNMKHLKHKFNIAENIMFRPKQEMPLYAYNTMILGIKCYETQEKIY